MKLRKIFSFLVAFIMVLIAASQAAAKTSTVRGVLFFSPTCQYCHFLIENTLPPLKEKYGDQLDIVGIDISEPKGNEIYQAAVARFQVPDDRRGVPTLVVGDVLMVGVTEVQTQLPGIIEKGLASGGVDWPDIPGLQEVLAAQPQISQPASTSPGQRLTMADKFKKDLVANSIAVAMLGIMILSVIGVIISYFKGTEIRALVWPTWIIPVLAIAGFGVAMYLTFIEVTNTRAVCGPVGDCNSVQESAYSKLFGVFPVGLLGAIGFLAIIAAWFVQEFGPKAARDYSRLAIWGMSWFGILFMIYLTFLEPFVIGATCAWCITSAALMTLIFWASTEPAKAVWRVEDSEEEEFDDETGEAEAG